MEQIKALNALAPSLALIKTTASLAAGIDTIQRATSAPDTYVFSELLETPQVQRMRTDDSTAPYYNLLEQFCHGTLDSYADMAAELKLPDLNKAQTDKLRLLSLLSYAKYPHNLTYENLMELLKLDTVQELEDVITTAIYKGLIVARLDPRQQRVNVTSIAPLRDVEPESVDDLIATLSEWSDRCSSTLEDITAQIAEIQKEAEKRHEEKEAWDEKIDFMVKNLVKPVEEIKRDYLGRMGNAPHHIPGRKMLSRKAYSQGISRGLSKKKRYDSEEETSEEDVDMDAEDDDDDDDDDEDSSDKISGEGDSPLMRSNKKRFS